MISRTLFALVIANLTYKFLGFALLFFLPTVMSTADFVLYSVLMSYILFLAPIVSLQYVNIFALQFYNRPLPVNGFGGALEIGLIIVGILSVLLYFVLPTEIILRPEIVLVVILGAGILAASNYSITRVRLVENWNLYFILSLVFGAVPFAFALTSYYLSDHISVQIILLGHICAWTCAALVLPRLALRPSIHVSVSVVKVNRSSIFGFFLQDFTIFLLGPFGRTVAVYFLLDDGAALFTLLLSLAAVCVFLIDLIFESHRKELLSNTPMTRTLKRIVVPMSLFLLGVGMFFFFFLADTFQYVYGSHFFVSVGMSISLMVFVLSNCFFIYSRWFAMKHGVLPNTMAIYVVVSLVCWALPFIYGAADIATIFLFPSIAMTLAGTLSILFTRRRGHLV